MEALEPIDSDVPGFGDLYDELPLWSAPFGLWILDRVPLAPTQTVLDLGAGTGFLSIELAERCGPRSTIVAVDPWHEAMQRLRRKVAQRGLGHVRLGQPGHVQQRWHLEPDRSRVLLARVLLRWHRSGPRTHVLRRRRVRVLIAGFRPARGG